MTQPNLLLICTVGGSPEPLAASLKHWRPSRVLFVPSKDTRAQIAELLKIAAAEPNGFTLPVGSYDFVELPDAQDFTECLHAMRRLVAEVDRWIDRGDDFQVVVDFTGGTKCMSAALALQAHAWGCHFSYVGGSERTKNAVGVVVSGKEQVLHHENPWTALGYQAIEDALTLFDQGAFGAASKLLGSAKTAVGSAARKKELNALQLVADGYEAWDRFDHGPATKKFADALGAENDLTSLLTPPRAEKLCTLLRAQRAYLEALATSAEPTWLFVQDLLANARRRGAERRFDDAVARLYRAIEGIAQTQLREKHGFADTGNVPLEQLPEPLRREKAAAGNAIVKLALQDDYALLLALGDPLAEAFAARRLNDPQKSNLQARNASILAHGFQPVGDKVYGKLLEDALALAEAAGVERQQLPQFPRLRAEG